MPRLDRFKALLIGVSALIFFAFLFNQAGTNGILIPNPDRLSTTTAVKSAGSTSKLDPARIAVASMNTDESTFDHLAMSNKFGYARKHGYDMKFDFEGSGFWHKFTMVENIIKEDRHDWIWWIDYDTLITNTTVKLEDIITDALHNVTKADNVDMILTADCFPLNAGSMIFRAHTRVLDFLKRCWKCGEAPKHPSEQDCMRDLIEANRHGERDKAVFVPQWRMNAFPDEIPCFDDHRRAWQRGMFVVHFAGAWAYLQNVTDPKGTMMRKYQGMIVHE
ncbi:MAG: hypothetical protein M1825_005240 [Sarcosagium campestre]|nr:MAG: hypothetical protein M1825_005240 [Sarcosagium campestre]